MAHRFASEKYILGIKKVFFHHAVYIFGLSNFGSVDFSELDFQMND